jgi:6-hydroxytryprostatin B O-methyltransferase
LLFILKPSYLLPLACFAMCQLSPLETLASQICSSAKAVSAYCQINGHPQPSFGKEHTADILPASAPDSIRIANQTLVEAALKIQQLATEPSQYLPRLAVNVSQVLRIYILKRRYIWSR